MKIACISLGCPKNQVDLDVMVHILLSAGHETVADLAEADVILVNTCGFIESAKTEAIENILEACAYKQQNPNLKVIVTGCLAERYRSQIEEEIPEVDAVVGCASNKAIDTIVERLFHGEDHLESYGAKKDFPLGGKRVIGTHGLCGRQEPVGKLRFPGHGFRPGGWHGHRHTAGHHLPLRCAHRAHSEVWRLERPPDGRCLRPLLRHHLPPL